MNDAVKDIILGRQNPNIGETATLLAHGSEVLAIATRAWAVLPPTSLAEIDSIGHQLEGIRRGLGDLRTAIQQK